VGETQNQPFQLSFNPCLKIDFQGSRVTSDSGLLLVRELDERLGLSALIAENILDDRRGKNTQLPLPDLLRQSIYSRLAGYEDVNDAERLSQDPTFRLIGSEKIWDRGAALPSRLHWFETEVLTHDENLDGLSRINRELLAKAEAVESHRVVLDMDSTEIPVYGEQEQSACNGHFDFTCYHPLLLFNGEGDCLGVTNLETPSRAVVRFYNKRGTAEQWIKEGKQAVKMTRLSCHRFRRNEVRLALSLLAYNLGNLWRRLALPRRIENWSLTSLQQRLVKTGGRLVKHARYYWLLLAEGHLNRRRFGAMLGRIALLPVPTG
jgi:Transposase DDE domain group 1